MQRVISALVFLVLAISGLADGKFYSTPVALQSNVVIPDQRALIHFSNGVERLVIETRFTGSGTNFAWVVPLPSQPVIEEASAGLFPTLQYLFRPQLVHDVPRYYALILALLGLGYLLLFVRPTGRLKWLDVGACLLVAAGASAGADEAGPRLPIFLVVYGVLICTVYLIRITKEPALIVFGLTALLSLVVMMFLPALAKGKAGSRSMSASSGESVSVLDRKLVGIFETTTITSRDPKALHTWLRENGFVFSSNSEPVIESYVKDGWVFVAAKIRRENGGHETSTPHPLSFTFKTERPVYPMRLTGVDNDALRVDLYVFGPGRARASHFKIERCTKPAYPGMPSKEVSNWTRWSPGTPNIVHPLLRKWVDGSPVATKLAATLTPNEMRQDVWLDWVAFSEKRSRLFSRQGALTWSLNWGSGMLAVSLLAACLFATGKEALVVLLAKTAKWIVLVAILVGGAVYFGSPKTEVRFVKRYIASSQDSLYSLYFWLSDTNYASHAEASGDASRVLANPNNDARWKGWLTNHSGRSFENYLSGGRVREEDSPGNFTLREVGDELEFVIYDAQGAEHVFEDKLHLRLKK
jgi:hypothetical protein